VRVRLMNGRANRAVLLLKHDKPSRWGRHVRCLFATPGMPGFINPLVGTAVTLKAMGHAVAWVSPNRTPRLDQLREREGIPILGEPSDTVPIPRIGLDEPGAPLEIFRALLRWDDELVDWTREMVRDFAPDVVVGAGHRLAPVIAAALEGVPDVVATNTMSLVAPARMDNDYYATAEMMRPARQALLRRYGVERELFLNEVLSPTLNVVYAPPEFVTVPGAVIRPNTVVVGPATSGSSRSDEVPFPWNELDPSVPLVYVAFGTLIGGYGASRADIFSGFEDLAGRLGLQIVVARSDTSAMTKSIGTRGKAITVPYAPQLLLLERASLFIGRGGNSMLEALYFGVPILYVELMFDDPVQGYFVRGSRVGRTIAVDELLDHDALSAGVETLLAPTSAEAQTAKRLAESALRLNAAQVVAELLVGVAERA
jgi:zeaxanthin glucosyltransferase